VTAAGVVTAREAGLVTITARSEGIESASLVRILPPPYNASSVLTTGIIVPGAGQFRVGRPARGTLTLVAAAGTVAWGYLSTHTTKFCASPVSAGGSCPADDVLDVSVERNKLAPGIGGALAVVLLSAIDASLHAKSMNRESERIRSQPWVFVPTVTVGAEGRTYAGWSIDAR
jgi:hypothetical protein